MIHISANLPKRYGVFNKLRRDNYPFNRNFTQYIETIIDIANYHDYDIVEVIGYIEDQLMDDKRLPDIPEGNELVEFRYKVANPKIETFYQNQSLMNKDITLLIIQMTLRLSETFGTSLHRLQKQLKEIGDATPQRITLKPKARERVVEPKVIIETKPQPVVEVVVEEIVTPVEEIVTPVMVTKKLEELTRRADVLSTPEIPEGVQVETNPGLLDFMEGIE